MEKKTINRQDLIKIRDFQIGDRNFILSTWLKGLYYGESFFNQIPKNIFMENHHRALEKVIGNPNVTIKIACLKEDPDTIVGYAVYRSLGPAHDPIIVLDWIFVKKVWRKIGVAKSLFPPHTRAYTHTTKIGSTLVKDKCNHLIFNPYLFV